MAPRRRKSKVTVALPPETVGALDDAVADGRYGSRSEALAAALVSWVREERRRRIDAEIDAYYDALTAADEAEQRDWAALGLRALARDVPPPTARPARSRPRSARRRRAKVG